MNSLFGLENKRILVLGGGQGIGEATARLLVSLGAHVVIVDREIERAEVLASDLAARGGTVMPFALDVLDDEAVIAGVARIEQDFGPLDGMATIIGMAAWAPLIDLELATWDEDHRRNLRYFFVAAREVARSLLKRQAAGSIVCVSSIDGIRSAPFHAAYGAAKAGLSNLVKSMAVEWSPHGVRANVVAPGAIVTPRIPHAGANEARMTDRIPLGRRGTAEDIAKSIVFLLSDMALYITGETLTVDGGLLASYPIDLTPPKVAQSTIGQERA